VIELRRRIAGMGGCESGITLTLSAYVAAVTFTLETLLGRLDHAAITGAIVAAAVAQVVGQSLGGFVVDAGALRDVRDAPSLSIGIAIGAIAAVASVAFTESLHRAPHVFFPSARSE
jgi:chloride channel protein, CIC family